MTLKYLSSFADDLKDPSSPLAIDQVPHSDVLLIAFGGMGGGMEIPPFEFFNLTHPMPVNKIYVRDIYQIWYHAGLPGIAHQIDGIATFLQTQIERMQIREVVTVGNSMGGYAAMLVGYLIKADRVLTFSPKTIIDPLRRIIHRDFWNWRQLRNLARLETAQREYFDLKPVLATPNNKTRYDIHYSRNRRIDRFQSERLRGLPDVTLIPYARQTHRLVTYLRDTGELEHILREALASP